MRRPNLKGKAVSGFTLVEMAIVLVIIGIILAGVMKGRDIVRGAQIKQFSQQFAQKWGTIAQTYYDKTGQFLNDGSVNGGTGTTATNPPNGRMDGLQLGATASQDVLDAMTGVGIEPCSLVKSKLTVPVALVNVTAATVVCEDSNGANVLNPWQTVVDGEYAGGTTVEVDLINLELDIDGKTVYRNCVVIYSVPTDVAIGLDTAVDGKADGKSGNCVAIRAPRAATATSATLAEAAAVSGNMPEDWGDPTATASAIQDLAIVLDY